MIRFGFLFIVVISACSLSDSDVQIDSSLSDQDLYDYRGEKDPMQCVYVDKYLCDYCGEEDFDGKVGRTYIGCKAKLDCKLFCTSEMPDEYIICEEGEWCAYWEWLHLPFSSCEKLTDYAYFDEAYSCACPYAGQMYTAAYHPDYGCKVFVTTCLPEGFYQDRSCDLPFND